MTFTGKLQVRILNDITGPTILKLIQVERDDFVLASEQNLPLVGIPYMQCEGTPEVWPRPAPNIIVEPEQ